MASHSSGKYNRLGISKALEFNRVRAKFLNTKKLHFYKKNGELEERKVMSLISSSCVPVLFLAVNGGGTNS